MFLNRKNWFPKNAVWANYYYDSMHYIPIFIAKLYEFTIMTWSCPSHLMVYLVHFWLSKMELIMIPIKES